jgi:hypothetical protein
MDRLPIPARIAPGPFAATGTCGHCARPPIAMPGSATDDYDLPARRGAVPAETPETEK